MNVQKLKRDPDFILSQLKKEGKEILTKKYARITLPETFERKGLLELGVDKYMVGIYAIIIDDRYACSNVPAMIHTAPTKVSKDNINDTDYYVFEYEPGAAVVKNNQTVKFEKLIYNVFDTIIAGGKVPWHVNYDDFGKLLEHSKEFANSRIGDNHEVLELLASMLARDPNNPSLEYRQILKSFDQIQKEPPYFSPLRSVQFLATNTTAKMMGSNYSEGIVSALVTESENNERIEDYLRA